MIQSAKLLRYQILDYIFTKNLMSNVLCFCFLHSQKNIIIVIQINVKKLFQKTLNVKYS